MALFYSDDNPSSIAFSRTPMPIMLKPSLIKDAFKKVIGKGGHTIPNESDESWNWSAQVIPDFLRTYQLMWTKKYGSNNPADPADPIDGFVDAIEKGGAWDPYQGIGTFHNYEYYPATVWGGVQDYVTDLSKASDSDLGSYWFHVDAASTKGDNSDLVGPNNSIINYQTFLDTGKIDYQRYNYNGDNLMESMWSGNWGSSDSDVLTLARKAYNTMQNIVGAFQDCWGPNGAYLSKWDGQGSDSVLPAFSYEVLSSVDDIYSWATTQKDIPQIDLDNLHYWRNEILNLIATVTEPIAQGWYNGAFAIQPGPLVDDISHRYASLRAGTFTYNQGSMGIYVDLENPSNNRQTSNGSPTSANLSAAPISIKDAVDKAVRSEIGKIQVMIPYSYIVTDEDGNSHTEYAWYVDQGAYNRANNLAKLAGEYGLTRSYESEVVDCAQLGQASYDFSSGADPNSPFNKIMDFGKIGNTKFDTWSKMLSDTANEAYKKQIFEVEITHFINLMFQNNAEREKREMREAKFEAQIKAAKQEAKLEAKAKEKADMLKAQAIKSKAHAPKAAPKKAQKKHNA